ncbi:hypothetical protein HELRODRAFT_62661 [Helobdella robusta]|uniref:Acylphosphatase n=1 Tax=Helobdella robusta TaxID=6412 RepID=T1FX32_HELRO|nr:hypothetical protein HELRODRAFT_62661 [Helobdella robusta]ESO12881.1 hypothetical protein HELRODRAFT_62661 [Helobdella robusta]
MSLVSVEYKVFGRVQGVFFRKYTAQTAKALRLVGWVKNEDDGTVVGVIQGKESSVEKMKDWLSKEGSPKSSINKCEFRNEKTIREFDFDEFIVKK